MKEAIFDPQKLFQTPSKDVPKIAMKHFEAYNASIWCSMDLNSHTQTLFHKFDWSYDIVSSSIEDHFPNFDTATNGDVIALASGGETVHYPTDDTFMKFANLIM